MVSIRCYLIFYFTKEIIILWKYENNIFIIILLRKIFTRKIAKILVNFSYKSHINGFYIYIIKKYIFCILFNKIEIDFSICEIRNQNIYKKINKWYNLFVCKGIHVIIK